MTIDINAKSEPVKLSKIVEALPKLDNIHSSFSDVLIIFESRVYELF